MELQQLRYILAVSQCGGFTKAAEQLFVSQPSISQQIQNAEEELGVTLFRRTTRSLQTTREGEVFCKHAQEVLDAYQRLCEAMEKQRKTRETTLTILYASSLRPLELSKAFSTFHALAPHITIRLSACKDEHLLKRIREMDWGVVFIREKPFLRNLKGKDFWFEKILDDPIHIFVCKGHPLTKQEYVTVEDLKRWEIVSGAEEGLQYQKMETLLSGTFQKMKKVPVLVEDHGPMVELVRSGQAIAAGNRTVASYYGLASVPFHPVRMNDLYIVYKAEDKENPTLRLFQEHIKDFYQTWSCEKLQKNGQSSQK